MSDNIRTVRVLAEYSIEIEDLTPELLAKAHEELRRAGCTVFRDPIRYYSIDNDLSAWQVAGFVVEEFE